MRVIEKIDFVFGNCEGITIDLEDFKEFYSSGIYKKIELVGNNIVEQDYIDSYIFILDKESDVEVEDLNEPDTVFNRFQMYKDISNITLKFSDGTVEFLNVEWFPKMVERDYIDYFFTEENLNQNTVLLDNGDLAIFCGDSYDVNVKQKVEKYCLSENSSEDIIKGI